ncbi:MAG: hypothetical protein ABI634_12880 [Acidobacteriota bacterium]
MNTWLEPWVAFGVIVAATLVACVVIAILKACVGIEDPQDPEDPYL